MSGVIQPFEASGDDGLNMVDRYRIRKAMAENQRKIVGAALSAQSAEAISELQHRRRLAEQARTEDRSVHGLQAAGAIYDRLVEESGGDPAKAQYLAGIALRGRDGILGQV